MKGRIKKSYVKTLLSDLLIIVLAGIIGGFLMYYIKNNTADDYYKSTVKVFVSNDKGGDNPVDAKAELVLAKDCAQLVENRTVMNQIIAGLDLSLTYADMRNISAEELADMVCVCVSKDSRIINICVKDVSPIRARGLADAIGNASAEYMKKTLGVANATVIEGANMPSKPIGKCFVKDVILGVVAGIIIAIVVISVIYVWDRRIKNKADVEEYVGLPVLTAIPLHDEVMATAKKTTVQEDKQEKSSKEKKEQTKATNEENNADDEELPKKKSSVKNVEASKKGE